MLMCRDLARIASDYIDDELGTMDKMSVKMHLMMCGRCRTFIGNLRASIDLLKGHSSYQMDETLAKRIDESIAQALAARKNSDNSQN